MMEPVWRILAAALLAAVLAVFLKKTSPDMAFLLTIAACCCLVGFISKFAGEIVEKFQTALGMIDLPEELFFPLVKTVGLAVLTKTAGDLCRDAGESGIGNLVETVGAFAAVALSLPLFAAAWELLQELL